MQLLHYQSLPKSITSSVISVGNFDGIHRGHELLIREVVKRAKDAGIASIIVTFDPHTRSVVNDAVQPVLSTLEEKAVLLERLGVDYLAWIPFNAAFAALSPAEFLENVVKKEFRASEMVMGEQHTFGSKQAGDKNFLQSEAGRNHINIFAISTLTGGDLVISSTEIRKSLLAGLVSDSVEMLGHPYLISGTRVRGIQKGTELGVPTINFKLPTAHKVLPPSGVYAAELEYKKEKSTGALYIGDCPTFDNRDFHLEFHALNFSGHAPEAGETGCVWVHEMIRPDARFESQNELVIQMNKDVVSINNFFAGERICR